MKVFKKIDEIRKYIKEQQKEGKTIGLVPTMGYLHEGHLSLIKKSSEENNITVVSIFVNPTQFGENEDLDQYPRDLERDVKLAEKANATAIFASEAEEIYPKGYQTYVNVKHLTKHLCGLRRPGHFKGVTTIVTKLFNIINPDKAYFGQKDAQQAIVIKRMVKDLNLDIEIVVCPIVRESDGLAKSSRNTYLSKEERNQSTVLFLSLMIAKQMIEDGERHAVVIKKSIEKNIKNESLAEIDYVSISNIETLKEIEVIKGEVLIALAVKIGNTRLIDNIQLEVNDVN